MLTVLKKNKKMLIINEYIIEIWDDNNKIIFLDKVIDIQEIIY